jgi:hypothetical protein
MGWHMNSLGEKLTVGAVSNKLLCISYCGWPVKTCSKGFTNQCPRCSVITAGARMYLFQEHDVVFLLYAFHQYFCFHIFVP